MTQNNQEKEVRAIVVPVTPVQQNCSIVWCIETKMGAVFDPGGDLENILQAVEEHEITIEKILITHAHLDHAGGAHELSQKLNVPIEGPHKEDLFLMESLAEQGEKFGLNNAKSFKTNRYLNNGDEVKIGNQILGVRHCPGHTPGHIIFFHEPSKLAIVGDVLFAGSIGRTDLPGGNYEQLIESIKQKLWPLGEDIVFVPGHGPLSNFKTERSTNPFVSDNNL